MNRGFATWLCDHGMRVSTTSLPRLQQDQATESYIYQISISCWDWEYACCPTSTTTTTTT